jgi:hypothetical protein
VQVVARTYLLSREISMVQSLRQWQVADLIGIGGAYYTSQKIFGDPDQGGTLLLAPGQGPINVLGKALCALACWTTIFAVAVNWLTRR